MMMKAEYSINSKTEYHAYIDDSVTNDKGIRHIRNRVFLNLRNYENNSCQSITLWIQDVEGLLNLVTEAQKLLVNVTTAVNKKEHEENAE